MRDAFFGLAVMCGFTGSVIATVATHDPVWVFVAIACFLLFAD